LQNSEKETQKDISEAAGVTEVTVRNRYKDLVRQLHIEIPDRQNLVAA
jgi:transcription initiation factor TFIIB